MSPRSCPSPSRSRWGRPGSRSGRRRRRRPSPTRSLSISGLDRAARRLGNEKAIGLGQYGTVVVSASYDRFPLPLYTSYLPPYFAQGDIAVAKAESLLSAKAAIERIYFIEDLRSQYLELSARGKRVLLNAYTLSPEQPEDVLLHMEPHEALDPETRDQIAAAWERVTQGFEESTLLVCT